MTDIEGFLTIYGHSDNLLNNKLTYLVQCGRNYFKAFSIDMLALIFIIIYCNPAILQS